MENAAQRKFKFTAFTLTALPLTDAGQVSYTDTESTGLQLRVGPKTKTWYAVGSIKCAGTWKGYRTPLGRYPDLSLKDARVRKAEVAARVAAGLPFAKEIAAPVSTTAATTFRVAREKFLAAKGARLADKSNSEYERILAGPDFLTWEDREVDGITRREVHDLIQRIKVERPPSVAHKTFTYLRAMFNWSMSEMLTESAPTDRVKEPEKPARRTRVLSSPEVVAIWSASDNVKHFGSVIRLLMLTGQRRDEIAALRWSEVVDLEGDAPLLHLPGDRLKNDLPNLVPLAPMAAAILRTVPRTSSEFVFTTTGTTPLSGFSKAKLNLDRIVANGIVDTDRERLFPLSKKDAEDTDIVARVDQCADGADRVACRIGLSWVLHDLRRTLVTGLNDQRVSPHVVEAVVNHVSGDAKRGVAGVYNHAQYLDEKREALELWARHIASLVGQDADATASSAATLA